MNAPTEAAHGNAARPQEAVQQWIDGHAEEIIHFAQELLRIPSVNPWFGGEPGGEAEVQEAIARKLRGLGAAIERWEPNADALQEYAGRPGYYAGRDFTGRPNQAALLKGRGGGRSLLLTGHVDVVPPGNGWTVDPFAAVRKDGRIYGRGAVDMKGGIAAMIMAVEAVLAAGLHPDGDITVGTVVDEEAGGMGTLDFVAHGYRADAAILTESTGLAVAPLCRGVLWGRLVIPGRSGHIELPQGDWRRGGGVDAIARARLYMDMFDRLNRDWALRKTHPYLPTPCQVYVAQLEAGEYPTAFANRAVVTFNAQYLPRERDEMGLGGRVKQEIADFVAAVAQTDPWLREHPPQIEWLIDADCGETPADHPFVQTCLASLQAIGRAPAIEGVSAHTDMGWFVNVGIPTVNFAGGEMRVAHQNDESISEDDLLATTAMIAHTIVDWCGVGPAPAGKE
jgi:acetylornithine deacetylase